MSADIDAARRRLENAIKRFDIAARNDQQLAADLARLLCVEVSGFVESGVRIILGAFAARTDPRLKALVDRRLKRFQNPKPSRIHELLDEFSAGWAASFSELLATKPQWDDSVASAVAIKNQVAHGGSGNVSFLSARQYAEDAIKLIRALEAIVS